jgi:hypothetical protein
MRISTIVTKQDFIAGVRAVAALTDRVSQTRSTVCAVSQSLLRTGHELPHVAYTDYNTRFDGRRWKIVDGKEILSAFDSFVDGNLWSQGGSIKKQKFLASLESVVEDSPVEVVFESKEDL